MQTQVQKLTSLRVHKFSEHLDLKQMSAEDKNLTNPWGSENLYILVHNSALLTENIYTYIPDSQYVHH
jgi:hypothetical protein